MIEIQQHIKRKLEEKHGVTEQEVIQCFLNYPYDKFVTDTREEHKTDPQTLWFISETDSGRTLKVCFIFIDRSKMIIKTAYEPTSSEVIDLFYRKINC